MADEPIPSTSSAPFVYESEPTHEDQPQISRPSLSPVPESELIPRDQSRSSSFSASSVSESEPIHRDQLYLDDIVNYFLGATEYATTAESSEQFVYDDADNFKEEIAELYSYGETSECYWNAKELTERLNLIEYATDWHSLTKGSKDAVVLHFLAQLEHTDRKSRINAAKAILYIAQGCWQDYTTDYQEEIKENVFLLNSWGIFEAFTELLHIERKYSLENATMTMADSYELRVILSVLYTIVEVMRNEKYSNNSKYKDKVETFCCTLLVPANNELLIITLFDMIEKFANYEKKFTNFPLKKMLLLLWKLILLVLGGLEELEHNKKVKRVEAGLAPQHDPTQFFPTVGEVNEFGGEPLSFEQSLKIPKRIRCWPKVRQVDYDLYLNNMSSKFLSPTSSSDRSSIHDLPKAIEDSLTVLERYIYHPLSEVQIAREQHPLTSQERIERNPTEILYRNMLPKFNGYMRVLLGILAASTKDSENKFSTSSTIFDVIPKDMPEDGIDRLTLAADIIRHQQIIHKAISAILLLLLKHFKLNHVYQFEYMCQALTSAGAIPQLMRFFDQNIPSYIKDQANIEKLYFPRQFIEGPAKLEYEEFSRVPEYSWRNVFVCINYLRVLNKIVKWKDHRIATLTEEGKELDLKDCLVVQNRMLKLYALKLIKMRIPPSKEKKDMRAINEVFRNVRYHLHESFLCRKEQGVDKRQKSAKAQEEERILAAKIAIFHNRRYFVPKNEN